MGLAREQELHPVILQQGRQPRGIAEEQIRTLVGGGAPGEADREHVGIQAHRGAALHLGEELFLQLAAGGAQRPVAGQRGGNAWVLPGAGVQDRKSTRLNSSHLGSSYAVLCLKTKY